MAVAARLCASDAQTATQANFDLPMLHRRMTAIMALGLSLASPARPQTRSESHFEVASIKPHDKNNILGKPRSITGTLVMFEGDSIASLLTYAFEVPFSRVVTRGVSLAERYDIAATLPEGGRLADVPEMVRFLLAERFHLRFHWESKMEDVFVLSTRGSISRLKPARPDETRLIHGDFVDGAMEFRRTSMAALADELSLCCSNRQVVNETNLAGDFDLRLMIGRDGFKSLPFPPRDGEQQHVYDEGAWRSAIQEFGLQAKQGRRGVPYLVIDNVDKSPTQN